MSDLEEFRLHGLSARSPRRGALYSHDRSHERRLIGRARLCATYTILEAACRTTLPCMEASNLVRSAP